VDSARKKMLEFYALSGRQSGGRDLFPVYLLFFSLLFALSGIFLHMQKPDPRVEERKIIESAARFIIDQKKTEVIPEVKKKKAEPEKKKESGKPIDLTEKPLLNQKVDETVEEKQVESSKKAPRKVYGLRRVYSTGLGAQGSRSDAVIGKLGNTLNTEIDTFKATNEDLQGQVVSATTVTRVPRLKVRVKPEYSREMLEKRIEGVVRAKVLIDSDGKIKQVIVLDDLGYGSKEKVYDACLKLVFEPALRGEEPVAVWQIVRFRFELTQG